MPVIDADTHVDECESTWEKLIGTPQAKYIPVTTRPEPDAAKLAGLNPQTARFWMVEGRLQARAVRDDVNHPPRVYRELEDVPGRLAHMDRMGVDVQVIFPTFFIRYGSQTEEAEYALTTTYNRWLAEKCAETNGRLRWAAVLPLLQPDKAVEELRWAKAHGACGIYKRGFDYERGITDSHFYPVFEEAQALDIPICLHTGHPLPGREWDRGFPIMYSMTAMLASGLPQNFPRLKWGFIEAGASWIPYNLSMRAANRRAQNRGRDSSAWASAFADEDIFRTNRFFVTIDPVDDIEYLLQFGTEDHILIGTDYSHTDISANLSALDEVRTWADQGKITREQAHKILETNPATFYGL